MFSKLCTSCDYAGSEKKAATGVTLAKCMSLCAASKACTAIDFGKGSRSGECFINTGTVKKHASHGGFDAYVKKTKAAATTKKKPPTTAKPTKPGHGVDGVTWFTLQAAYAVMHVPSTTV